MTEKLKDIAPGEWLAMPGLQTLLGGYHKTTIYGWIRRGKFPPAVKFGGSSRWPADEIRNWMRERMADRRQWAST